MQRMFELIGKVKEKYPNDDFFKNIEDELNNPLAFEQYTIYENALQSLDDDSWKLLSDKAIEHFNNHREGQLKQHFFNQLNEVFAYQFLVDQKYNNVQMIAEDKFKKTPDIAYKINGQTFYCEVKTISRSDEDIERFKKGDLFSNTVYQELSQGFLIQLWNVICRAYHLQIKSQNDQNGEGIVFIIVKFDDFTLTFYKRYKEQIMDLLHRHQVPEIYIKIYSSSNNQWIYKKEQKITSS